MESRCPAPARSPHAHDNTALGFLIGYSFWAVFLDFFGKENGHDMESAAFDTGGAPEHEIAYNRAPRVKFAPETSDQYPRVVAALDPKRRVIECAAGLQWIIQVRKRNGAHPWESVSFCRTKEALLRLTGNPAVLQSLPDWFPEA
jgi:hypothetical protein